MNLGCTSFVYPADYVSNAEKLAGLVDDIELLIFEGAERKSLPTRGEVRRLGETALRGGFSYTVHLPADLNVCSDDDAFRRFSVDRMEETACLTAPLNPRGFVLHLPGGERGGAEWTERALSAARHLGAVCGGKLFVENLAYPFSRLEPVIERSDARLCLDIGHAERAGDCWKDIRRRFGEKIGIVHFYLHDANSGRHFGIQDAPRGFVSEVAGAFLSGGYDGVFTMEVFGEEDFFGSKEVMEREIKNWAKK